MGSVRYVAAALILVGVVAWLLLNVEPVVQERMQGGGAGSAGRKEVKSSYSDERCGAKVVYASPLVARASAVLDSSKDKYMAVPCDAAEAVVVVEMCEPVEIKAFSIANYELFSSFFETVAVAANFTMDGNIASDWMELGTYALTGSAKVHKFNASVEINRHVRYVKFTFAGKVGKEKLCTVSQISVFGNNFVEEFYVAEQNLISDDEEGESVHEDSFVAEEMPKVVPTEMNVMAELAHIDSYTCAVELQKTWEVDELMMISPRNMSYQFNSHEITAKDFELEVVNDKAPSVEVVNPLQALMGKLVTLEKRQKVLQGSIRGLSNWTAALQINITEIFNDLRLAVQSETHRFEYEMEEERRVRRDLEEKIVLLESEVHALHDNLSAVLFIVLVLFLLSIVFQCCTSAFKSCK